MNRGSIIFLVCFLFPAFAYAACQSNRQEEIGSGESVSVSVCAEVLPMANIVEERCAAEPELEFCDMVNYAEEVKHPCEINPKQTGCSFYRPENTEGVSE